MSFRKDIQDLPKVIINCIRNSTWLNWLAIAVFIGNMVMWYNIFEYLGLGGPHDPAKWVQVTLPLIVFVAPIVTLFAFRWLAGAVLGFLFRVLGKEDSIHGDKRSRKPCCRKSGKGSTPLSSSENKN